jgi:murein DD-endopeptidase MepM/ murein hydrolase activator NlpD
LRYSQRKSPICNRKSLAGNFSQAGAMLSIPAAGAPADEGTLSIVQPAVEAEDPPLETVFACPEPCRRALPPEEPKAAPVAAETVFGAPSLAAINEAWQANSLAAVPPLAEPDGILWGAGALAAMAGMTAYYQQKRREEEEAQRAAVHAQFAAEQAEKERQQKAQAKVMAKLEKQWAEERRKEQAYQQWKEEQEQADKLKAGKKVLGLEFIKPSYNQKISSTKNVPIMEDGCPDGYNPALWANLSPQKRKDVMKRVEERDIFHFLKNMSMPTDNGKVTTHFGAHSTMDEGFSFRIVETGTEIKKGQITKEEYLANWGIHAGVDISSAETNRIFSVYDGIVVSALTSNINGGNKVVIEHKVGSSRFYSFYFHLESYNVDVGESVQNGQVIGAMGDTGSPGAVHLHFEVRKEPGIGAQDSGGFNFPFAKGYWWANSAQEMQTNWVDISSKFGGYDEFLPLDWRLP